MVFAAFETLAMYSAKFILGVLLGFDAAPFFPATAPGT
jgi:hypothetical protein